MATEKRVYLVKEHGKDGARLIEATSPAQAVRHAARGFTAAVASQHEIIAAMHSGSVLETIGEPAQLEITGVAT
jgi:hypothetical protein